jgi:GNAT superfamily N-acetyltransferase
VCGSGPAPTGAIRCPGDLAIVQPYATLLRVDPSLDVVAGLPQGWASDVEVLVRLGSALEDRGDHLVVRTPSNPGYRWGNLIVVREPDRVNDAHRWLACCSAAFLDATHRSIGLPGAPDHDVWTSLGLRVESDEVLRAEQPPRARPLATGYEVRRLRTEAQWAAAIALEVAEEPADPDPASGESPGAYQAFVHRHWQSRREASARGAAAFFAAYRGDEQVAHLGIVRCADHARYQSVRTRRDHRGRGLAGHLLQVAGAWAANQGAVRWVIVVEPGTAAARLYRSVGFAFDSRTWQASRIG